MAEDRIDCNELGVDDVAIDDVELFRLERMTEDCFWICCYKRGYEEHLNTENEEKYRIIFWANLVNGKLVVKQEE